MAFTVTLRGTVSTGNNQSSYTTSSSTPGSGKLCIVSVTQAVSGTPTTPTLSGTGGYNVTWTQVRTTNYDTSGTQRRLTVFRGVTASATAGTITVDFGGQTQTHCTRGVR